MDKKLLAEYSDPLTYMDASTIRILRRKFGLIAIALLLVGCVCLVILLYSSQTVSDPGTAGFRNFGGGVLLVVLAFGLPVYALYRLFTIKRSIIRYRRNQLMHAHLRSNTRSTQGS